MWWDGGGYTEGGGDRDSVVEVVLYMLKVVNGVRCVLRVLGVMFCMLFCILFRIVFRMLLCEL